MHFILIAWLLTGAFQNEPPATIVAKLWATFEDRTVRRDADALADLYTVDARLMEPDSDDAVGRVVIHALIKSSFAERRTLDLKVNPREVVRYGDIIYDQGDFTETTAPITAPRGVADYYGRYFAVWMAQPDGSWRLARLMASPKKQPSR